MASDPLLRGLAAAPLTTTGRPSAYQPPGRPAARRGAHTLSRLASFSRPLEAASPQPRPRDLCSLASAADGASSSSLPSTSGGLSGRWRKDKAASDSMDAACDAVALPWVLRKAVNIVKILELEETPLFFRTRLKAGGILDIVETYPWAVDAEEVVHGRRDKRKGGHRGRVERLAPQTPDAPPGAAIHVRWSDPYGGVCTDAFSVGPDGRTLVQATEMVMNSGALVTYKTVYRRERG